MHLGMTGRFSMDHGDGAKTAPGRVAQAKTKTPKHEHIVFHLGDGTSVRYTDARRFGYMDLIPTKGLDSHALFKGLGVEPLSGAFTAEWLATRLKGKATSIKSALIDQRLIAGLGNIYACEALFRAGISPMRLAGTLATKSGKPTKMTEALVAAVKAVLEDAIKAGGSSLRDYRRADGRIGRFQHRLQGLWPRRQTLLKKRLRRNRTPHRPRRTLDLLLSNLSTLGDSETIMFANVFTAREPDPEAPKKNGAYETILVSTKGKVGLIQLNRPQALNALNTELISEVNRALESFEADPSIGCIVITGNEKAFAAGVDIKEMHQKTFVEAYGSDFLAPFDRISHCRKPIIAAVAGYALGGGCELAMACDIILAADTAVFGQPEITLGIMPGNGGTQRLTRAVGKAKAMELCLTGRRIDAEEAERSNLVSRVVPAAELMDEAIKVADKIANLSQHAVMMIKEAINRGFATTLAEGTRFERGQFYSLFATEDQKEGMAAFIEKRKPEFKNR